MFKELLTVPTIQMKHLFKRHAKMSKIKQLASSPFLPQPSVKE